MDINDSKNNILGSGLQVLGEVYTKNINFLKSKDQIKTQISEIIKKYGLEELGSVYYQFSSGGFTGVSLLRESHIAIHTWPEFGFLTLDVFICNYIKDNKDASARVFDDIAQIFTPDKVNKKVIKRGN